MATVIMRPGVQTSTHSDSSAETSLPASAEQALSEASRAENGVWRGDLITFKIWLAGFLIMLVINVWDMIAGLFR
jgi:hypothetical protein